MTKTKTKQKTKYSIGEMWGALRKAWRGFKIAKVSKDKKNMTKYALIINELQVQLGLKQTKFKGI